MTARLRRLPLAVITTCCVTGVLAIASPSPARAFNPVKPLCGIAGLVSGLLGKACTVVQNGGKVIGAGKDLLSGKLGAAAKKLIGGGGSAKVGVAVGLTAVVAWVLGGAKAALQETAALIGHSTTPQLASTWFSSTYWRMAELAAVLTLPFLFAAAVQAVLASDLALLARAALGYLPLALLAVAIAAPVTILLLAASDEMSAIVSSAAGSNGAVALLKSAATIGVLASLKGSAFLAFLVGFFIAIGAFALWLELLIREAAVYVVVLMLPLAFSALVWPARRIWAVRAVEVLVALILAKFVIVAVLTLAAAAIGHSLFAGPSAMVGGLALVTLATFAPWALIRLLPMAEVAGGAAGSLRRDAATVRETRQNLTSHAHSAANRLYRSDGDAEEEASGETARENAHAVMEHLGAHQTAPAAVVRVGRNVGEPRVGEPPSPESEPPKPGSESAIPEPAAGQSDGERIPGMPAIYQQPDFSWEPIVFDPHGGARPGLDEPDPGGGRG